MEERKAAEKRIALQLVCLVERTQGMVRKFGCLHADRVPGEE